MDQGVEETYNSCKFQSTIWLANSHNMYARDFE